MKDFAELQTMFKSAVPNSESMMETGSGDDNPTLERKDASEADVAVAVAATDVAVATDAVADKVEREERDVAICTQELGVPEPEQCSNVLQDDGGAVMPEVLVKHPLQYVWTLWYLENDRTKTWEDMQNEITSFDTVEDFWNLYNHIKPPSEIKMGSDYSLFKKGIRPMWEDVANHNGGRWVIGLNKILKDDLDKLWMDVLLCLIGEVFDRYDEICGAVVNIRGKSNKISIWTANGDNKEAVLEIGHKLRDALRLGPQNLLQYQLHRDAMTKQGSNVKTTFTL